MNIYKITITSAPEVTNECGETYSTFKEILIEAERLELEKTSYLTRGNLYTGNYVFYIGDECVGVVTDNCIIIKQ